MLHTPRAHAVIPESLVIEVCVDSIESAVAAVKGGADRLEVCANLANGGGTTPTLGLIRTICRIIDVPLMIMIRPRVGGFLYSREEVAIMLEDIRIFKELGLGNQLRGFVLGVLNMEGRVDVECMKILVDEILPLEVCFHRAFDTTRDAVEALHDIDDIGGISRILTSGQANKVMDGLSTLETIFETRKSIIEDEAWGLAIMPGSGIDGTTLPKLLQTLLPLNLREVHLSGGRWIPSEMLFKRSQINLGAGTEGEMGVWRTEEDEVRVVREIADAMWTDYHQLNSTYSHR